jgi:hypothetical protein
MKKSKITNLIASFATMLSLSMNARAHEFPFAEGLVEDLSDGIPWSKSDVEIYKNRTIVPGGGTVKEKDVRSNSSLLGYSSLEVEESTFYGELDLLNVTGFVDLHILVDDKATLRIEGTDYSKTFKVNGSALWRSQSYKEFVISLPAGSVYHLYLDYENTANLTKRYKGEVDVDGVVVFVSKSLYVDLDVDSDNQNLLERSKLEDELEESQGADVKVGRWNEEDQLPMFADGIDINPNTMRDNESGYWLSSGLIQMDVDFGTLRYLRHTGKVKVKFIYDGSNPSDVEVNFDNDKLIKYQYTLPEQGSGRVWLTSSPGAIKRNKNNLSDGGDYIEPNKEYDLAAFEGGHGFWYEGVEGEGEGVKTISIELTYEGKTYTDKVLVRHVIPQARSMVIWEKAEHSNREAEKLLRVPFTQITDKKEVFVSVNYREGDFGSNYPHIDSLDNKEKFEFVKVEQYTFGTLKAIYKLKFTNTTYEDLKPPPVNGVVSESYYHFNVRSLKNPEHDKFEIVKGEKNSFKVKLGKWQLIKDKLNKAAKIVRVMDPNKSTGEEPHEWVKITPSEGTGDLAQTVSVERVGKWKNGDELSYKVDAKLGIKIAGDKEELKSPNVSIAPGVTARFEVAIEALSAEAFVKGSYEPDSLKYTLEGGANVSVDISASIVITAGVPKNKVVYVAFEATGGAKTGLYLDGVLKYDFIDPQLNLETSAGVKKGVVYYNVKLIYGAGGIFDGENGVAEGSHPLWEETPFVESVLPIWKLN